MKHFKEIEEIRKEELSENMEILTSRPEGMDYSDYKEYLKLQKKWIKNRLKGSLVYKASERVKIGNNYYIQNYLPFKGKTKYL